MFFNPSTQCPVLSNESKVAVTGGLQSGLQDAKTLVSLPHKNCLFRFSPSVFLGNAHVNDHP